MKLIMTQEGSKVLQRPREFVAYIEGLLSFFVFVLHTVPPVLLEVWPAVSRYCFTYAYLLPVYIGTCVAYSDNN
jgi:hypothetical protein